MHGGFGTMAVDSCRWSFNVQQERRTSHSNNESRAIAFTRHQSQRCAPILHGVDSYCKHRSPRSGMSRSLLKT